jgi:lysophospholipase L1-like esterase
MTTNPHAIKILCYGDSNTWGQIPGTKPSQRYSVTERWTGLLQTKLGNGYEVIEEGLNGRTTNLDDPDATKPGRNGLQLLMPILETHRPFDMMILMLGTNDFKIQYNRQAEDIVQGVRALIEEITTYAKKVNSSRPNLILISPPLVKEVPGREIYKEAEVKSHQLASLYQNLAQEVSKEGEVCLFINAAQHIQPSLIDGVHLEKESNQRLAEVIHEMIKSKYLDKHNEKVFHNEKYWDSKLT